MNFIGSTAAAFAVKLSTALTEQVDIAWQTVDGTGKAGVDYEAASGVLSFLPGETEKQIQVTVSGQSSTNSNGLVFHIKLTPPINAILENTLVDCTIYVTNENNMTLTSLVVAQGKRGLAGLPGMSAYDHAVSMGYVGTLQDWMNEIADASQAADRAQAAQVGAETAEANAESGANRAEAAATSAVFAGTVYATAAAGVDPVTGVPDGGYYYVHSPDNDTFINVYRNVGGVATNTGKSFASSSAVQRAVDAANLSGKVYPTAAAGVNPISGVPQGNYFSVRSALNVNYLDEYQNVGGAAVATGKVYPSKAAIDAALSSMSASVDAVNATELELRSDVVNYDPAITYDAGAIVKKDGKLKEYDGAAWNDMPITSAQISDKGQPNGVATIDAGGLLTLEQRPILDDLTTNNPDMALSAAQGKVLADRDFGIGQTYQVVTASRALLTTYTNTSSKPIRVYILSNANASSGVFIDATINGQLCTIAYSATNVRASGSFDVPVGGTYSVGIGSGTLFAWVEYK